MYRSMMQVYVKGSDKAAKFYQNAFDARLIVCYPNPDGTLMHAELDVYGQVLALSELRKDSPITGNTMQFCLHFGEGQELTVKKIHDALIEGAEVCCPLGPCEFSPLMFGLIDQFGVNWCVFV